MVQLIQWESKPAVELDIQNAEGGSETIVVTPSHPFYVEDKGWIPAGKLGDCDKIVSAEGGALHVIQIRPVPGGLPVFNFTVEGLSNYFVGELGGLVHNAPCGGKVDLTGHRKDHILNRHRHGAGKPGKSEFPASWSDDKILHEVSDIATDPNAVTGTGKWDSPYSTGTRDGVEIRVDFYPDSHPTHSGKISTAYPINSPLNPE